MQIHWAQMQKRSLVAPLGLLLGSLVQFQEVLVDMLPHRVLDLLANHQGSIAHLLDLLDCQPVQHFLI